MNEPGVVAASHGGPGWYADPWRVQPWRWWDGTAWTAHVAGGTEHKPRLPAFLSVPVLIGAIITIPIVLFLASSEPLAVLLGLTPLLIVWPVLAWLDRVEPEPQSSRLHALLWGAMVAGLVSGIMNGIAAELFGESVAAVVSAPLVEEATKGLAIYWALRRHQIDSITDGIAYAGWAALGFAIVEDFTYFAGAAADGFLVQIFVLRALLTPFAHPLFTAWIGLAIGLAVTRGRPIFINALWGYALAVASHAAWNGSLVYAEQTGNQAAVAVAALCFVLLFLLAVLTAFLIRRGQRNRFVASVPMLAARYGVSQAEAQVFAHWRTMLKARRRLPRDQRSRFDAVHTALARLSLLHDRPGPVDQTVENRLVDQLRRARTP